MGTNHSRPANAAAQQRNANPRGQSEASFALLQAPSVCSALVQSHSCTNRTQAAACAAVHSTANQAVKTPLVFAVDTLSENWREHILS